MPTNPRIHPTAVIDEGARIAPDVAIGPYCVIEAGTTIGAGCVLDAHVVIGPNVQIGRHNLFYAHCAIGRPPQLLGVRPDSPRGGLCIGDNNVIREQVTIHPSIYPGQATRIGNDNLLMIGVHLGHDCILDDKIVISNYSQISGHCRIETGVWLSGLVAVHQFVTFGRWCYAAGFSGVNHDVPPFVIISGHYPPEVRAVNKRGLKRAGFSEEQQRRIAEAFKRIYRSDEGVLLDRVRTLAAEDGLDENVRAMVEAILHSSQHRFGRHLEIYREH